MPLSNIKDIYYPPVGSNQGQIPEVGIFRLNVDLTGWKRQIIRVFEPVIIQLKRVP